MPARQIHYEGGGGSFVAVVVETRATPAVASHRNRTIRSTSSWCAVGGTARFYQRRRRRRHSITHHSGRSGRPCPPGAAATVAVAVTLSFGARVRVSVYGVYACVYVLCVRDRIFFRVRVPVCVCDCVYVCARYGLCPLCICVCVCVCASLPLGVVNKNYRFFSLFLRRRFYFGQVRIVTDDTVYVRRPPVVRRSVALSQSGRHTAVARRRPAVSKTATDLFPEIPGAADVAGRTRCIAVNDPER